MSYSLEEVVMTEEFAKATYDWYCENRIINHELSRAEFVRAHNQRIEFIFSDLNELRYLIEEQKHNEAVCHYGWMDEEAKELVPQAVVDYLKTVDSHTENVEEF
jgi:hypothetical protein